MPLIVSILQDPKTLKTPLKLRMAVGCLANLISDNEQLAEKMEPLLPVLLGCCARQETEISALALLAVLNSLVNDSMTHAALNLGAMQILREKMTNPDSGDISAALNLLEHFLCTETVAAEFLMSNKGFDLIFSVIDRFFTPEIEDENDEEEVEDAREISNSVIKSALALLDSLAEKSDTYRKFFLDSPGVIQRLFTYTRNQENASWCKLAEESSKVLAFLSLSSEVNRKVLFAEVPVFLEWLGSKSADGTQERRMSAAMALGNLAEDEKTATQLIEAGARTALCAELARDLDLATGTTHEESANVVEAAQNSERSGKEMRIKQLCCGSLKNLAIQPDHKLGLIQSGAIPYLVALLKQQNQITAHAAIVLLKSLFLSEASIEPYFQADPGAAALIELTSTDEENKRDNHVLFESSRAIAVLSVRAPEFIAPYIPESAEAVEQLSKIDGKRFLSPFTAMSNLLSSQYGLLRAEGAAALASVFQKHPNSALPIVKAPELLKKLATLIEVELTPPTEENAPLHCLPQPGAPDPLPPLALLFSLLLTSTNEEVRALTKVEAAEMSKWIPNILPEKANRDEVTALVKHIRAALE